MNKIKLTEQGLVWLARLAEDENVKQVSRREGNPNNCCYVTFDQWPVANIDQVVEHRTFEFSVATDGNLQDWHGWQQPAGNALPTIETLIRTLPSFESSYLTMA